MYIAIKQQTVDDSNEPRSKTFPGNEMIWILKNFVMILFIHCSKNLEWKIRCWKSLWVIFVLRRGFNQWVPKFIQSWKLSNSLVLNYRISIQFHKKWWIKIIPILTTCLENIFWKNWLWKHNSHTTLFIHI